MVLVPSAPVPDRAPASVVLAQWLEGAGCVAAFGVLGGAIAPFVRALTTTAIRVVHTRHEGAAGFAAIEASLATGRPAVVFATTGPGLTNSVTGMVASRREGARVIFITGSTPHDHVGRGAFQETSGENGLDRLAHGLASLAVSLDDPRTLERVLVSLARGLARPDGFTAHLAFPLSLQGAPVVTRPTISPGDGRRVASPAVVREIAEQIANRRTAIWVGFGARAAAPWIRELADHIECVVISSPRGKGVFPEDDPRHLGVTGFGGHEIIERYRELAPEMLLVLGTRMGEMTSFWDARLVPPAGLVHVDLDEHAFGAAFPNVAVRGVHAEIGQFCADLLAHLPRRHAPAPPRPAARPPLEARSGPVRPARLMDAIQRVVVDASDAIVLTEAGNAFAWTTHLLRFREPGRYRVSTGFGAMGAATAGVVGVAVATGRKAVAVVGDGAMLMHLEVSTAVVERAPAIWIVLNDGRYGMIEQGMRALGWTPFAVTIGKTDFVALARAVGADGVAVDTEAELDSALRIALAAPGPFVVDVRIDARERAPFGMRNQHLARALASGEEEVS